MADQGFTDWVSGRLPIFDTESTVVLWAFDLLAHDQSTSEMGPAVGAKSVGGKVLARHPIQGISFVSVVHFGYLAFVHCVG